MSQLSGCKVAKAGAAADDTSRCGGMGERVTLDPESDAEEAVLVTAAASAVVGFLRERQGQPGGSESYGCAIKTYACCSI